MADFEELKLSVSLVDNASAGLARIRGEIGQLTQSTSQLTGSLGNVSRGLTQVSGAAVQVTPAVKRVGDEFKALTRSSEEAARGVMQMGLASLRGLEALPELALGLRETTQGLKGMGESMALLAPASRVTALAIGGVLVGVVAVTAAVTAYFVSVFKFAKEMKELNDTAKSLGMSFGVLKDAEDQARKFGVAAGTIVQGFAGIQKAQVDLYQNNSQMRQRLLSLGVDANFINQIAVADPVKAQNMIRGYALQLQRMYEQSGAPKAVARGFANKFVEEFNLSPKILDMPEIHPLTPAQRRELEAVAKLSDDVFKTWGEIDEKLKKITFTVLAAGLPSLLGALKAIDTVMEHIVGWAEKLSKTLPDWLFQALKGFAIGGMTGGPAGAIHGAVTGAGKGLLNTPLSPSTPSQAPIDETYRYTPMSMTGSGGGNPLFQRISFTNQELVTRTEDNTTETEKLTEQLIRLNAFFDRYNVGGGGGTPGVTRASLGPSGTGGGGFPGTGGAAAAGPQGIPGGGVPGTGGAAAAGPQGIPGGGYPPEGPGGPRPMESGGGSGGVTAPAGTPIQRKGMATVTTSTGKKFQVDARYAANFQGFINDYEARGGVIGPNSGTLGARENASGHPIGTAFDVNQVARNVRRGGVSLPNEVENELAKKWGLVSGANWRNPDAGHFGVRSPEVARKALQDQGIVPSESSSRPGPGKSVKGSWFGSIPGWTDPSEPSGHPTSSGVSNTEPGIALPSREGLGKLFEVTTPDGGTFFLPQTDVGPNKRTGRGIDITSAAAARMGYNAKNFPTGGQFSYRPAVAMGDPGEGIDPEAMGGPGEGGEPSREMSAGRRMLGLRAIDRQNSTTVNSTGKLQVDVNAPPGTKTNYAGTNLLKHSQMRRQTQMMPTVIGPSIDAGEDI